MPEGEELDVNPVEGVSRWRLAVKAAVLRSAASLSFTLSNRTAPVPPPPTRTIWVDSTLSRWKGPKAIRVYVWERNSAGSPDKRKRTALINFHGGGFLLGSGTDDARWVAAVQDTFDAVVFSVEYRLAPGYPYPTPVEDCVDSILQLRERAEEFGIDPDNIILSGFSAGATLALSSWVILQDPSRWRYEMPPSLPAGEALDSIAGMVLFYPPLDWTISRSEKRERSSKPEETLPSSMTDLFDACYIHPYIPHAQRHDPRLSPGLMPAEMMNKLPPLHLCLCEHDMLLAEGLYFADRAKEAGRVVTSRVVPGQKHAWDKTLPFNAIDASIAVEYEAAIVTMRHWLSGDAPGLNVKTISQLDDTVETQVDLPV
ncbi:carboxylesterase A [Sodiomyces alkalinus F11]|uniref:Carboxylesterase A n=1 Tax=Sodiomyces alkalinus (strain CBS 110278 / VKM F-3762 / F11) TaxID=1314773 RepID=A0A3N2Q610_SODAK|nr:carboxylesterase A [Sodiomyces alkalinus F11]ROT42214.1 carboxylesterase A [Sodiomyces alkalinus F11]